MYIDNPKNPRKEKTKNNNLGSKVYLYQPKTQKIGTKKKYYVPSQPR